LLAQSVGEIENASHIEKLTLPPGIELELWLEANGQSLPRRLIVTYRSFPDEPNFVAEFFDWNLTAHPPDAESRLEPPEGVEKLQLGATLKQSTGARQ